jgi:hypothetical protein
MAADKSQWVRLLDVFVLGPFMIWYALMTAGDAAALPAGAAIALFVGGVLTIVYNGSNWLRNSNWV